ncbi:glycosyltransferase family 2 protein [Bradyrhizobium sp. NBAIM08]|uniref:glycosyltransferase family 2 protein n=1 Tax=Bradyrhizobium sp. NBAIM08 TaxID=2793815 RepID=UPI001CD4973F|nr:glycosyltransferase family 2 protein [Bradyrhizobium sp. NBAIM08]MCA1476121.1 glycosyltransferase family 2 protein [Bradyrhizobium sp. NBAIM08]
MVDTHPPKLVVLVTCFNRKAVTLEALRALPAAINNSFKSQLVLVDDGTDGTSEAVRNEHPEAILVKGSGSLFWNGGMRLAWQTALALSPDFFLWLNDDTTLRPSAIADLLTEYRHASNPRTIVVGRTIDPHTRAVSYGGLVRSRIVSRLNFRFLTEQETECHTMNGNCVLIPAIAAKEVGINSENYRHAFGDIDYGLRARRLGYRIIELKQPVAQQEPNQKFEASIGSLTLSNWRFITTNAKGIPWREWYRFCYEFGGPLWPLNFAVRYLKILRLR